VGGGVGVVTVATGVAYGFEVLLGELEECAGGIVWIVGDVVRDCWWWWVVVRRVVWSRSSGSVPSSTRFIL